MKSANQEFYVDANFYSGRQWAERSLTRKYPPTNHVWNVGLMDDIASERFFVLHDPDHLHENRDPWGRWMLPWKKNDTDELSFKWADTERVYDRESNWDFQFRWTTIEKKRIKLWRRKP
tara:strand:+ start:54049 stop:54405 length:357 start_codon:yes stop_codon:yes gene_type:complete